MQSITNLLGTFAYSYVTSTTGRVDHIDLPNSQTQFDYFDVAGDLRLKQIKHLNPAAGLISQHDYTYDPTGQIASWKLTSPAQLTPQRYDFDYDAADQLRGAALIKTTNQAVLKQYEYDYDSSGNRKVEQIGSAVTTSVFNNLNQLISQSGGGQMRFRGAVSEPSFVTVGGAAANVDATGKFDGETAVVPGNNTVAVVATDGSGNSRTNNAADAAGERG